MSKQSPIAQNNNEAVYMWKIFSYYKVFWIKLLVHIIYDHIYELK